MKQVKRSGNPFNMIGKVLLVVLPAAMIAACTTARVEDVRVTSTGIQEGEGVVIMARSYHLGNETETKFIDCVGSAISRGSSGLRVVPNTEFVDALFPWFEPRTAPSDTKGLLVMRRRPGRRRLFRICVVAKRLEVRSCSVGSDRSGICRHDQCGR